MKNIFLYLNQASLAKKSIGLIAFMIGLTGLLNTAQAQSNPLLTHFVFDKQGYNPGYVGAKGTLEAGAIYRNQWWTGVDGAPKTVQIFANTEFFNSTGIGINIVSDKIGLTSTTSFDLAFSYRVKFENSNLALGIMPRFERASYNWTKSTARDPDKMLGQKTRKNFNVGVGLYYNTNNFYAGISMPKVLDNSLYSEENYFNNINSLYFISGYVFSLAEKVKFYPSGLFMLDVDASLKYELNANIIFNDAFIIGGGYRQQDAVTGLVQYIFKTGLKAGIAVDFAASKLKTVTAGSYEIFVGYTLKCDKCRKSNLSYF